MGTVSHSNLIWLVLYVECTTINKLEKGFPLLNSDLPLGTSLIMPMAAPSVFRPPAGVLVIDWQGGAVDMTYIINTYIIAGIQYVELMAQVTTGLVF